MEHNDQSLGLTFKIIKMKVLQTKIYNWLMDLRETVAFKTQLKPNYLLSRVNNKNRFL